MKPAYFQGLAGIWAGVSLGGALIAAPAKFQVEALTPPLALQVGQAQFAWLWICEGVLCVLLILAALLAPHARRLVIALPVAVFLIQMIGLVPTLDARTELAISGTTPEASNLHLVFVVLEVLKCLTLTAIALGFATRDART